MPLFVVQEVYARGKTMPILLQTALSGISDSASYLLESGFPE
jgi:hypothetical protein